MTAVSREATKGVKERPILFSSSMIIALLRVLDPKTQTRRIMKPQPHSYVTRCYPIETDDFSAQTGKWVYEWMENGRPRTNNAQFKCPYGIPGDRLWVREEHFRFGHWEKVPGVRTKGGRQKWKFVADEFRKGRHHKDPETPAWHKRLARFMPHKFCRISLELTGVRVERVQDISEEDAKTEGVLLSGVEGIGFRDEFTLLWDSINAEREGGKFSWASNPWVWVLEFKRLEAA